MPTPPAPRAPLAQLRLSDPEAWELVCGASRSVNPGTDAPSQALAAALLGDLGLARSILLQRSGWTYPANGPITATCDLSGNASEKAQEVTPPPPGVFCQRHYSWLCQAETGACQGSTAVPSAGA